MINDNQTLGKHSKKHKSKKNCAHGVLGSGGVWWSGILPSRGTVHEKGEALPVSGVSWLHDSPSARDGPREGSIVGGSRGEGESCVAPAALARRMRRCAAWRRTMRPCGRPGNLSASTCVLRHTLRQPGSPLGPGPAARSRPFRGSGPQEAEAAQPQDPGDPGRATAGREELSDASAGRPRLAGCAHERAHRA